MMASLLNRLDTLERRVASALRDVPGATALACFGSRATGEGDGYADLDLTLIVEDLQAARAVWPGILGSIGPVRFALRMDAIPDATSYCVVFTRESLYHKLDISLCDSATAERTLAPLPHRWIWRQPPSAGTRATPSLAAYLPDYDLCGHLLLEELISLVRYAKSRRRGRHLTCWRFARGAVDTLLRMLAAGDTGTIPGQLSTWDYVELDARLGEEQGRALLDLLDWSTPERMDRARVAVSEQIVACLQARAVRVGEAISPAIERPTLAFVRKELSLDG
jgi:hypothetical protein